MEKVTIREVKKLHITINEPFCVIHKFSDGTFELIKNIGNDKILRIWDIAGLRSVIEPITMEYASRINELPSATEKDIECANKILTIMLNNL